MHILEGEHNFVQIEENCTLLKCSYCGCLKYSTFITKKPTKKFHSNLHYSLLPNISVYKYKPKYILDSTQLIIFQLGLKKIKEAFQKSAKRMIHWISFIFFNLVLDKYIFEKVEDLILLSAEIIPPTINAENDTVYKEQLLKFEEEKQKEAKRKIMEKYVNQINENNINFAPAYEILVNLLNSGIIFEDEIEDHRNINIDEVNIKCLQILNHCYQKINFIQFDSVGLSFAIILFCRCIYGLDNRHEIFEKIYSISNSWYEECLNSLKNYISVIKSTNINA